MRYEIADNLKFNVISAVFLCFIILSQASHSLAYDSDNDGVDTLADTILALEEQRLKESVHTLLVLTGQNPSSELYFTRSNSGNIVTDLSTSLMWQDSRPVFGTEADGVAHCSSFGLDGFDDWRMPTFEELQNFFKDVDQDGSFDLRYWGSFTYCTAAISIGGYVKTPYGTDRYGGEVGDQINFSGGAAVRCVRSEP
jgi:hypothetical protein